MHRALVLFAAGCGFQTATATDGGPGPDTPADGSICVGSFVAVCRSAVPDSVSFATPERIDTDHDGRCKPQPQGPDGPDLCVIAGMDITVSASISAVGRRPLVLAAFRNLTVMQGRTLGVASVRGMAGAGANDPICVAPSAGTGSSSGGGAGAGGSMHGRGGAGKAGNNGTVPAGVPTDPIPVASVARVIGGCPGSRGGDAGASPGGSPGDGGGGLLLIAGGQLTIAGTVAAGGAGGDAPEAFGGGGGGGSGGFIGLDATTYTITGTIAANGGGGSSGGPPGRAGNAGEDGSADGAIAAGGFALTGAGAGGNGSIAAVLDGSPGGDAVVASGGGGGGSSGLILVTHTAPPGAISPPPVVR